ncbi:MAG: HAD-IIIA family hydrolase [Proteobacteria bacterium]|nr:HAD-IIIA family hydrolase [Pseudomonadota bacterium]
MKLVLLDRDGVINVDRPDSVKSRDEFCLIPRAAAAIKLLNEASILTAIVTNQAVVGRGELEEDGLEDIHAYLRDLLKAEGAFVDKIFACTSADPDNPRRKPHPGLLLEALEVFHVKHFDAVLIGDTLRDLEAARTINCPRILVRTGKGRETLEKGLPNSVLPVTIFNDLFDAVSHLLQGFTARHCV